MFRTIRKLAGAVAVTITLGACSDDPVEPGEPEIETLRLLIGANDTVFVANGGVVTSGPIALTTATDPTIVAQWLMADGTPDPLVTDTEFELRVESANTSVVTFTPTGAFTGTLNGLTVGNTTMEFVLWHLEEDHDEFGEGYLVPVVVN